MTSYTWAMSLFGLQQMLNVLCPSKSTQAFNHVMKATFRAGDNLQQGLVDMTFGVFTLGMLDRGGARATGDVARQTGEALRQGSRVVSQAVDALSQTVQSAASAAASSAQQGWGPV